MPDIVMANNKLLRDMGDGTFAEVVAVASSLPREGAAPIADTESLSAAVDLADLGNAVGLRTDADWDAASVTLQGSLDGVTYENVVDEFGAEVAIGPLAAGVNSRPFGVDLILNLMRYRYLKVRSGTALVPVNQVGATVVTIVCRPL